MGVGKPLISVAGVENVPPLIKKQALKRLRKASGAAGPANRSSVCAAYLTLVPLLAAMKSSSWRKFRSKMKS